MMSFVMVNLKSRLAALEQEAANAALAQPHRRSMSDEEFKKRWDELAAREIPEKTMEEIRDEFRVHAARLRGDFEPRHGNLGVHCLLVSR